MGAQGAAYAKVRPRALGRSRLGRAESRRAVGLLLGSALAAITAVALLQTAASVRHVPVTAAPRGNSAEIARGFYEAVNRFLETGDETTLAGVVAPDLVLRDPPPAVSPDRAGLIRYLTAVRATYPDARLIVEDLVAGGDRAMARVTVRGGETGRFLGRPVEVSSPVWGGFDAIRVADGRVAEVWSDRRDGALAEELHRVALDSLRSSATTVRLERISIAPGARWQPDATAPSRIVWVAEGTATIAIDPESTGAARHIAARDAAMSRTLSLKPGTWRTVSAGDVVVLPASTRYEFSAGLPAPMLLAVAFPRGMYQGPLHADEGNAVSSEPAAIVEVLAESAAVEFSEHAAVTFGRLMLSPQAAISLDGSDGPLLLAVEAGTLGLEPRDGTTGVSGAASSPIAGEGAGVAVGFDVTLRVLGNDPAVALVVAIGPAEGGAETVR